MATQFLTFLGLQELIVGSLALYCLHLLLPAADLDLPSTGQPVADIALLAAGAALVGKLIILLAAVGMAVGYVLLRKSSYGARLGAAGQILWSSSNRNAILDSFPLEQLEHAIAVDSPERARALDTIRYGARFSYAAALLTIGYGFAVTGVARVILFCATPFFGVLALLTQADYLATMARVAEALSRPAIITKRGGNDAAGHQS